MSLLLRLPLIILIGLLPFDSISQSSDYNPFNKVSLVTPNAASLGKYGEIPVSYHTGVPDISIPIHTIEQGALSLPISLSYHSSGLKVMEISSWVGAGWTLMAGGAITRTVKGAPDEGMDGAYDSRHGYYSHYGYNLEDPFSGENSEGLADGELDSEPDLYFFNFLGYSGKFIFDDNRTPVLLPEQDIKIQVDYDPLADKGFMKWIITTPDGTKYHFGLDESNNRIREVTQTQFLNYRKPTTTWWLTTIESADGQNFIYLDYTPEEYSYYSIGLKPIQNRTNPWTDENEIELVKMMINGHRLAKIRYNNGEIRFIANTAREDLAKFGSLLEYESVNTDAKRLDAIEIDNNAGDCKRFTLSYGYFNDQTTSLTPRLNTNGPLSTDRKRLKLNSVQESYCNVANTPNKPPYRFTYYDALLVPRRLSLGQDHWGYYNGVKTNSTLIPSVWIKYDQIPGADRNPRWPEMRAGTIATIQYPTGGTTAFDFESHYTWVEFTQEEVGDQVAYLSAGFSSNDNNPPPISKELTQGTYKVVINLQGTCTSSASVTIGGQTFVADKSNSPYSKTFTLSGGVTNISLGVSKPHACGTGNGATMYLYGTINRAYAEDRRVGGLRIREIRTHDGYSAERDIIKRYSYTINEGLTKSSGVLYSRPTYLGLIRNDLFKFISEENCNPYGCMGCTPQPESTASGIYYTPTNFYPMETTNGNHIGYSYVKVEHVGNGYSTYSYYALPAGESPESYYKKDIAYTRLMSTECSPAIPNYPAAPLQIEYLRGTLLEEWHYDATNKPISYTRNTPPDYEYDNIGVYGAITYTYRVTASEVRGIFTEYRIRSAKKTFESSEISTFDENLDPVVTTNSNYYSSRLHNQITKSKTSTSNDTTTVRQEFKYAPDYMIPICHNVEYQCETDYQSETQICTDEFISAIQNCEGAQYPDICKHDVQQAYFQCQSRARKKAQECNFIYEARVENCIKGIYTSNYSTPEVKATIGLANNNQITTPVETSNWRSNVFLGSIFLSFKDFGYQRSIFPEKIFRITPGSESTFTPSYFISNPGTFQLVKDSEYVEEGRYLFDLNGNVKEKEGKDGIKISYIWGYEGRYTIAEIINASYSEIEGVLGLGFTLQGPGGNTLSDSQIESLRTGLPSAQIKTYNYKPGVGMISQTDQNGRNTFYDYDELGRLTSIKDNEGNLLQMYKYNYKQ